MKNVREKILTQHTRGRKTKHKQEHAILHAYKQATCRQFEKNQLKIHVTAL